MSLKSLDPIILNYVQAEMKKSSSWFEYYNDNILNRTDLDIIIHQANCFNIMNAGIAKVLSDTYPEILVADKKYLTIGDTKKLGSFSSALVQNKNNKQDLIIINCYTQFRPGSSIDLNSSDLDSKLNRFKYLNECLNHLKEFIQLFKYENIEDEKKKKKKIRIGVPWMIGCGIAGGDINATFKLFEDIFSPVSNLIKIVFIDIN